MTPAAMFLGARPKTKKEASPLIFPPHKLLQEKQLPKGSPCAPGCQATATPMQVVPRCRVNAASTGEKGPAYETFGVEARSRHFRGPWQPNQKRQPLCNASLAKKSRRLNETACSVLQGLVVIGQLQGIRTGVRLAKAKRRLTAKAARRLDLGMPLQFARPEVKFESI